MGTLRKKGDASILSKSVPPLKYKAARVTLPMVRLEGGCKCTTICKARGHHGLGDGGNIVLFSPQQQNVPLLFYVFDNNENNKIGS